MEGVRKVSIQHQASYRTDTPINAGCFEYADLFYELEPITIICLPVELLLFVFGFLNINDRLSVSSVCSSWRDLIFSSQCFWEKKQLKLKCSRQSQQSKRSCLYTRKLGHFLRKLNVTCEHVNGNNHQCKHMAVCFRKLVKNLKAKSPALTSFKVTDLRLAAASPAVIAKISLMLTKLLETLPNLKSFQMSSAQWPPEEGKFVMSTLLKVCVNTLETLQIDCYFVPKYIPTELDQFSSEIVALNKLTKLAIDYFYLTADSVIALAESRRGQMRKLKLLSADISPNTQFISPLAWKHLTTSCPAMKVEFCVKGFVISPSRSIPAILDPVLHISMIRLSIGGQFTFIDTPRLNMAAVFHHIMVHFKKRLVRFEMDIDNYNDFIDAAFIRMVKKCKHLLHLKVIAFFQNEETDNVVQEIVKSRRAKQAGSTNRQQRDIASPLDAYNSEGGAASPCCHPSGAASPSCQPSGLASRLGHPSGAASRAGHPSGGTSRVGDPNCATSRVGHHNGAVSRVGDPNGATSRVGHHNGAVSRVGDPNGATSRVGHHNSATSRPSGGTSRVGHPNGATSRVGHPSGAISRPSGSTSRVGHPSGSTSRVGHPNVATSRVYHPSGVASLSDPPNGTSSRLTQPSSAARKKTKPRCTDVVGATGDGVTSPGSKSKVKNTKPDGDRKKRKPKKKQ